MADARARLAGELPLRSLIDRALAGTGAVFVVLFAGGLIVADLIPTTTFPTPTQPADEVVAYFTENRGAVRALATFHAFAALALLVFAAHLSAVLRAAAPGGSGVIATLAAAGGAIADPPRPGAPCAVSATSRSVVILDSMWMGGSSPTRPVSHAVPMPDAAA